MRVGILTFPNSESYGAVLQMLALYQVCEDLGYETEIINYYNLWMKQEKHMGIGQGKNRFLCLCKRKAHDLLHICMRSRFSAFEKQMKKYPQQSFSNMKKLPVLGKRYGAVICGSDQVWNPDITNQDLSYFLDFCSEEISRISYAPSFGVETLPDDYGEEVAKELTLFDSLSVREEAGQELITQIASLESTLVLDPSLLLSGAQWQRYEKVCSQADGGYILYYTVHSSPDLWKHCKDLAKKTNMKILRIGSNVISKQFRKDKGVEFACDIGPAQWLYLIRNASYVVTNSFHGTAFSINYRKNFYVEYSSKTNSRLSNIVNLLGLEDRVLREGKEIVPGPVDYSKTEIALPKLKEGSMDFLKEALKRAFLKWEENHA